MAQNSVIKIDYSRSFSEMLKHCHISRYQIRKILDQLDGFDKVNFTHRGVVSFEVHDFVFIEPTMVRGAKEYIRRHNPESRWEPFDIEHLIHYYHLDPNQSIFRQGLVYASRRTFMVDGISHVFVLENRNNHPNLELVPDDHPRAAYLSTFPGQRKITG